MFHNGSTDGSGAEVRFGILGFNVGLEYWGLHGWRYC